VSGTKMRVLQAACEAAGGTRELAAYLSISEAMLRRYLSGGFPLPDPLFLASVDFVLARKEPQVPQCASWFGAAASDEPNIS